MEIDNRPAWLSRAMNKNTPTRGQATVQTASEYSTELGGEVLFPTLRMGKGGKLRDAGIDEALEKNDYILIKGPPGKETAKKANAKSKQISLQIGRARGMNTGGALMALKEPAGLGTSPMTQKTSPPVGNKKAKVEKMPKRGAAPKVVDPRDEVMKLVAKKLKQDKTSVGIASPTAPMPTEMPAPMTTALAAPQVPAKKAEEEQLLSPTPVMAAKGKSIEGGDKVKKEGKGLAVVIDMGSPDKPEYEEASMGTPSDPPPGATGDEVKDNQHVLLSEGELVVPANVVRYHGLGMYEGLRRDALKGLGEMEDAGQVEYIDNDVKTAAAGMTIMNAQPNVATLGGIQKQQAVYNPALGQYGTAKAPEAASAKFVQTPGFIDKNKDGIDDKLQPSINKGIASPVSTGAITPASLNLGPTTNPNVVVGAGNVGSYTDNQTYKPGDGTTPPPADDTPAPVAPTRVVQQDSGDGGGGDPEIDAGLGGARTSIGGKDYAIQYDFSGNITGIADVKEALATGRANYFAPNPELMGLISTQTTGQKALGLAAFAPVANAFGFLDDNKANIEAGKAATAALNSYRGEVGMRSQDMPMGRPSKDVMQAYATEKPTTQPIDYSNVLSTAQQNINTKGLAAPQVTNVTDIAQQSLAEKGTVASNIAPEITTPFGGRQEFGQFSSAGDVSARAGYEAAYDKYSTQFAAGMGPTGTKPGTTQSYNANLNALNTIAQNAITPEERLAANHVAQDIQMSRISEQSLGSSYDNRSIAEQAELERGFNVDETFGSGKNPGQTEVDNNFSNRGQNAVNSNGGSVGTGRTDNGSKYSINSNGTFTFSNGTTTNVTDSKGNPINDPDASKAGPDQTNPEAYGRGEADKAGGIDTSGASATAGTSPGTSYADDAQASESSSSKIVCTEMYRQTQLDDWAQAMKTWYIYQKKYLTPIHEIGYHSLFKPFVRGMKVNRALTNLGAYLAEERTKHLRHVLTKGKSKDSVVGNVFCKIIHPIVYLVGLAVHKK
jgi:hypothetical protein